MSAGASFFVDTNVLLYFVDRKDPAKNRSCREWMLWLWAGGRGRISWQVLHEFYVNSQRKSDQPVADARRLVTDLAEWRPIDTSLGLIERAWQWSDQAQVAYWDGLILAAAERAGSRYLLSEDFQSGRTYGTVQVISPFSATPEQFA